MQAYRQKIVSLAAATALGLAYGSALTACSQATPPKIGNDAALQLPRFDIISVRETRSPLISERNTGDGYVGQGNFLATLIMGAYGIHIFDRIVGLPVWYRDRRFDITAKVDPGDIAALQKLTYVQRRSMFRQILEERFQFKMHEEEQIRAIYVLTSTGKPGPFLERSPSPDSAGGAAPALLRVVRRSKRGQLTLEHFTMANFAEDLSNRLLVDVVDETHLDGLYNLQLDWNPEDANPSQNESSADPASDKPSIFTAVREQLGLKLSAAKGPVKVWVIDHVELPSEN